jgi:two-component system, NarL family, sensor histidine kinase UhpB
MLANAQADADPATRARLQETRDLAHEILDDLRGVVSRLRPMALDELGVTKALESLAATVERQTGIPISTRLCELDGEIPPMTSLVIYRVAQEALTNAVRHAPGAPVELELKRADQRLCLRVSDAGPGFPEGHPPERCSGLRLMAERALLIDADLELKSSGSGTTIVLSVPNHEIA